MDSPALERWYNSRPAATAIPELCSKTTIAQITNITYVEIVNPELQSKVRRFQYKLYVQQTTFPYQRGFTLVQSATPEICHYVFTATADIHSECKVKMYYIFTTSFNNYQIP